MYIKALILLFFLFDVLPIQIAQAEITDSITQFGITWKFSQPVEVGRFVTGDYYVVGSCTIVSINPPPGNGRNGSELNPPLNDAYSGFDSREEAGRYNASMCAKLPINMKPGDALISTISVTDSEYKHLPDWLRRSDNSLCPVKSACVLTCLASAVPPDAFRPSYCDRKQKVYLAGNLKRNILPSLPYGRETYDTDMGTVTLNEVEDHFIRVWLNLVFFSFDAPIEYQPQYGRELARAMGIASLILMTDLPTAKKEKLLIGFVQNGIDLWGIGKAGFHGWQAFGGHGSGRKWPIIFAGIMLGDSEMAQPSVTLPNLQFGEDMQTLYKTSWTGAKVVYAGHNGVDKNGNDINKKTGWGQYEHLQPKDWPIDTAEPGMNESYRRCCTSLGWVGEMLCAKILHAEKLWNHDAFFDYVDRWMTEDDSAYVKIIKQQTNFPPYSPGGLDYTVDWARQRQTWDPFVMQMWKNYRYNLPPDLDSAFTVSNSSPEDDFKGIIIYPNPAGITELGSNTIKIKGISNNSTIRVFDFLGNQIAKIAPGIYCGNNSYRNENEAEWDCSYNSIKVSPGVYFCVVDKFNGKRIIMKIIIRNI